MTEDEERRAQRLRAILEELAHQQRRAELARRPATTADTDITRYREEKARRAARHQTADTMYSTRTMRHEDWRRIQHFTPNEFQHPEHMGYEFVHWLDRLRDLANVPITITSSYRTPEHNAAVGGATDSAHTDVPCNAVDIGERPRPDDPEWTASRWAIITSATALGCRRIGTYADGSIHLDMTHDRRPAPRMWRHSRPAVEDHQKQTPNAALTERNTELYQNWHDIAPD